MTYRYSSLAVAIDAGVATVAIDNPPLNPFDGPLLVDLDRFAADVAGDRGVRAIVFGSADPDFFVPHGDMGFLDDPAAFAGLDVARDQPADFNPMMRVVERVRALPQATIGVLRGFARGGGAELFSAFDMRFASVERGFLAQMETPTGIIPGAGATAYLPRLMGRARTLEVILGAGLFDAATAERYGWINRALPDAELDGFVSELARRIARLSPMLIAAAKTAVDAGLPDLEPALRVENEQLGLTFADPAAARLTRAALAAGAQTREGEKRLEAILAAL